MKRILITLSALFLAAFGTAQPVLAFDPYTNAYNNIIFLDDPAMSTCTASAGSVTPTTTKLDDQAKSKIEALKSVYQEAAAQTKIPWEVFAAIDYREDNNDPNKSMLGGEPLGTRAVDSGNTPTTKLESVLMGAGILKGLAKGVYDVDVTQSMDFDKLQKAFIVYNRGYSYQKAGVSPDKSPYVMNQYDAAHKDMTFPSLTGETLAGRTETGRLGALTVYANLTNGSLGGSCGGGAGVGGKVDYTGIYPDLQAGTLSNDLLCVPRPSQPSFKLLKGPACASFLALDAAYQQAFGKPMPAGQGYRTAEEQIRCGGTITNPGGNNPNCARYNPKNDPPEHLWGTAIDFSGPLSSFGTKEHDWLVANGPSFGWFLPTWAQKGGSRPEPWHFQYYFVGHNPNSDKLESLK